MNTNTSRFYNTFSFYYPIIDIFLKPQKKQLCKEINSLKPGKLLEIGVGNGKNLKFYKKHEVTGIDTSKKMLTQAKKYNKESIELILMDAESLNFLENSFDYIIISHVLAVVKNPNKLLNEAQRVLKPQGKIFILNHFTPNNWLKYIDKAFMPFSKYFHFNSYFTIQTLKSIKKLLLEKEINFGKFSYFKLLIYSKL